MFRVQPRKRGVDEPSSIYARFLGQIDKAAEAYTHKPGLGARPRLKMSRGRYLRRQIELRTNPLQLGTLVPKSPHRFQVGDTPAAAQAMGQGLATVLTSTERSFSRGR